MAAQKKSKAELVDLLDSTIHPTIKMQVRIRAGKRWQRLYKHFIGRDKIRLTVAGTSWSGYLQSLDSGINGSYPGQTNITFIATGGPV